MKHTGGKWYVGRTNASGFISIRSSDCRTVCEVLPQMPIETKANAEYIVRAVNCHAELIEACKHALAFIESNMGAKGIFRTNELYNVIKKAEGGE